MTTKFLICITFLLLPRLTIGQAAGKYSVESLKEDFSILRGALEESHAGIYWYRTKAEMDQYFNAAALALDHGMTELEVFRIVAPVISGIGCGHTWIATTESTQQKIWESGKVLPLKLKFISGKAYCLQNNGFDSASIQQGDRILNVNGFSVDSLLKLSNRFSPGDGFIEVGKWRVLDNVFNQFFTLYIDQPDQYRITMERPDGQIREVLIEPLTMKEIASISQRRYPEKREVQIANIKLTLLRQHSAAVLKIKEFSDWKSDRKKIEFRKELRVAFERLDSSNAENLIIDLRDNDGGNERYGLLLYSYLTHKSFTGYKQIDFRTTHFSYRKYSDTHWFEYMFFKMLLKHRKINDSTFIAHDHISVPLDQEGGKALLNLKA